MRISSGIKKLHNAPNRFVKKVKTPVVLQMEATECGAAALAIVLGFYGKLVPLEELRVACGVSRNGSKAGNIVKAARVYGLVARGFRYDAEELKSVHFPAILYWQYDHFLVLEGFGKGFAYLNDPAIGPYKVTEKELEAGYSGVTLLMKPGVEFCKSGSKRSIVSMLFDSLKGFKSSVALLLFMSVLLIIPGLCLPALTRIFVDNVLTAKDQGMFLPMILGLALSAAFLALMTFMRQGYLARLKSTVSTKFSRSFMEHLTHLPMEFFMQRFAGDISTRVSFNNRVSDMITGRLASAVMNLAMAVFFLAMMLIYDPVLAVLGAGIALINFLFLKRISETSVTLQRKLVTDDGMLSGTTASGLETIETMKANGTESDFFARWAGYQAKLLNEKQHLGMTMQKLMSVPALITMLDTVAILALGGLKVMAGQMTLGTLIAFQGLLAGFVSPINSMVSFGNEIQSLQTYLGMLGDVYGYPVRPAVICDTAACGQKLSGLVELKNVTFGYCRMDPPLIEDFSLRMEPGSMVALVGGSGSGKSTVAKLVANLYGPWSGEILFDGKPRSQIPPAVFSGSFSMVDQEISIFEGSVRDNITLWNRDIPQERVLEAARDACICDVILDREGGFDLMLDENGRRFSGGEKQRMEIARALAADPVIMVMDEATSALDPVIEKEVMDRIRQRGCSCLVVAHRLSTIIDCDEIIVMSGGRIQERGTHEELMRLDGQYARLVRSNG